VKVGRVFVCGDRAVEGLDMDLRTRKGREAEVIAQVREHGGFSVFWATENLNRAHALTRLIEKGRIKTTPKPFPWMAAELVERSRAR
jgi:hypothetical protein